MLTVSRGYRGNAVVRVLDENTREPMDVVFKNPTSTWVMVKDLSGCSAKVMLPRCSILEGTAFNASQDSSVYAVCADIMFMGSGKNMAKVAGVSVLPEGNEFLSLALYCADVESAKSIRISKKDFHRFIDAAGTVSRSLIFAMQSMNLHDPNIAMDLIDLFSALTAGEDPPEHLRSRSRSPSPVAAPSRRTAPVSSNGSNMTSTASHQLFKGKVNGKIELERLEEETLRKLCLVRRSAKTRRYNCLQCGFDAKWADCLEHMLYGRAACRNRVMDALAEEERSAASSEIPLSVLKDNEAMRQRCLEQKAGRGKKRYICPVCHKTGPWAIIWDHIGVGSCWARLSRGMHGPTRDVVEEVPAVGDTIQVDEEALRQMCLLRTKNKKKNW